MLEVPTNPSSSWKFDVLVRQVPSAYHYKTVTEYSCRQYSCYCCQQWHSQDSLIRHLREHVGVLPFSCNFCKKEFLDHGHVKRHVRECHLEQNRWKCPHCQKKLSRRWRLRLHLEAFHYDLNWSIPVEERASVKKKSKEQKQFYTYHPQSDICLVPKLFHDSSIDNPHKETKDPPKPLHEDDTKLSISLKEEEETQTMKNLFVPLTTSTCTSSSSFGTWNSEWYQGCFFDEVSSL